MTWWQTVLSVALGGAVSAGTTVLGHWMQGRRKDRDQDRELLRAALHHALRFRRVAQRSVAPTQSEDERSQRRADLWEAAAALEDALLEVAAFGPAEVAASGSEAFDELGALRDAMGSGDTRQLQKLTLAATAHILTLVDAIRAALHLRD